MGSEFSWNEGDILILVGIQLNVAPNCFLSALLSSELVINFERIYIDTLYERENRCIDLGDLELIFKVTQAQ